jgi:hypothetical protein
MNLIVGEVVVMKIVPQKYRVAFKFNTLYYPFTYPEILNSLASRKYAILAPPQPIKSGARIYISGHIATKSGCFIELNEAKKIIACESTSVDSAVASVNDIVDLSKTDFKLNISEELDYCELSGAVVVSDSNPIDIIKKFSENQYQVSDEILGAETASGSIRIIPKNGVQTDRKWFDITIAQKIPSASKSYYVEFVFRNANDFKSVADFISKLDAMIFEIINKIGGA